MRKTQLYRLLRNRFDLHQHRFHSSQVWFSNTVYTFLSSSYSFLTPKSPCLSEKQFKLLCGSQKRGLLSTSRSLQSYLLKSFVNRPSEYGRIRACFCTESILGSGIKEAVLAKCSHLWDEKVESFRATSLQDVLKLPHSLPEVTRDFWRFSRLRAEDVLKILMGFQREGGIQASEERDVEFCWRLFSWAGDQAGEFHHLPQSYKLMVSMLVQAGRLGEAETLLHKMEICGIKLGSSEVFSRMIEGFVEEKELEKCVATYDWAKSEGLVLTECCYQALLDFLLRTRETRLALSVFNDALEIGWKLCAENNYNFAIKSLCKDRKIHEARKLLERIVDMGIEPRRTALNAIVDGYCEKKDYDDLLIFMKEWKFIPDSPFCNKIIASQCRNLGTEKAWQFLQQLESLGFISDQITFAVLVSWSCRAGQLKDALIYLSVSMSRGLQPDIQAYHALIGGLFKNGMGKHVKDILREMDEKGVTPCAVTFKALLAGYCRSRKFDDAKQMVAEMVKYGLTSLSPVEDLLSKAFEILGLNHLNVKIKRDNSERLVRTEFFDSLGNGLFLETDVELFEKLLMDILDDFIIPNLNNIVIKECDNGNVKYALQVKNKMVHWDQKLSLSSYSKLLECFLSSVLFPDTFHDLLDEMVDMRNELHEHTLNLLIQAFIKKKMMSQVSHILDTMLHREVYVKEKTFSSLILGFCKQRDKEGVRRCWNMARMHEWSPSLTEWKTIVRRLCKLGMVEEVFKLFELVDEDWHETTDIYSFLVKEFCIAGLPCVGHVFLTEIYRRGLEVDDQTFNHLFWGFCRKENFYKALEVLELALEKKLILSMDVFEVLIAHLCRSNELQKALNFKEVMLSRQVENFSSVYRSLINGFCQIGKIRDGVLLLHEIILSGIGWYDECFNVVLKGICRENQAYSLTRPYEFLCFMIKMNAKLSMPGYQSLVRLMCKRGTIRNVLSVKKFMLAEHLPIGVYNILLYHLLQNKHIFPAMELLDEMYGKSLHLDEDSYNILVHGYYECGMAFKAVEMLESMVGKNMKPSNRSLRAVMAYLVSNTDLKKALNLSETMELRGWLHGSTVQTLIVDALLSHGMNLDAEQFLDRLVVKGTIPDSASNDLLIRRLCRYRRLNKAIELLNLMLKRGTLPVDVSYNSIICGLCLHGALDQALDFHAEMLHKNLIPSIMCAKELIRMLCDQRRAAEAERLLVSMCRSGQTPKQGTFQMVINSYLLDKNMNKASEVLELMQQKGYQADFRTQWSLISNLNRGDEGDNRNSKGFLSRLLSGCGFHVNDRKAKDSEKLHKCHNF